jgi:serine protease Do
VDWENNEPWSRHTGDDPWDRDLQKPKRRIGRASQPESHDSASGHAIGSCDEDISYDSTRDHQDGGAKETTFAPRTKQKKAAKQGKNAKRKRGWISVPLIAVVTALAISLCSNLLSDSDPSSSIQTDFWSGFASSEEDFSGNDNFSVDIDPDEDGDADADAEEASENGPSDIARYEADGSYQLELHSSEGLEALTYQEIYAKVAPSVVSIAVYGDDSGAYATGIILSEDGYILTNQHVVANQSYAQVTTADNVSYDALLVGEDPNTDLALLKIDAEGLTPAEFGRSDELVVGDECFAIGNPLGINYRSSFSNGIVSALNRTVNMNDYTMTLIQTTTALNSGNSGGPLINIYGQVIGVNNMKIMSSETTVEGLGFAIPSTTAQRVANSLARIGSVEHPVIGITCYAVTAGGQDGAEVNGILVATVDAASDAYAAGLEPGDIIIAIDGQTVEQVSDVNLSALHVGDSITLTVYRDGDTFEMTIALVEQNDLG